MERVIHFGNPLEKEVADILDGIGIKYVHESEIRKPRLDFYLPDYDVYIEVKHSNSDRTQTQIASKRNVILIQGRNSIDLVKKLFNTTTK